jgi:hypothetical protein
MAERIIITPDYLKLTSTKQAEATLIVSNGIVVKDRSGGRLGFPATVETIVADAVNSQTAFTLDYRP